MATLTPLAYILVDGVDILTVDSAGFREFIASCADYDRAYWVASSLSKYHDRPVHYAGTIPGEE